MRHTGILLIAIILTSTACEKTIPYDEQTYTPQLVVNGMIESGKAVAIRVTESQSILADYNVAYEEINNCQTRLFEDGTLVDELGVGVEGEYIFDHIAQAFRTYRVEVDHDRLPSATCETTVPGPVHLTTATGGAGDDFNTAVNMTWGDTDNANFYQILVYKTLTSTLDTNLIGWTTSSPYFAGDPTGDGESYYYKDAMLLDELFKNGIATLDIEAQTYLHPNQQNDEGLAVVLLGCSESYYYYRSSYRLSQEGDGGLFSQPVQIYSNVDGGLGVLAAISKSVRAVEL